MVSGFLASYERWKRRKAQHEKDVQNNAWLKRVYGNDPWLKEPVKYFTVRECEPFTLFLFKYVQEALEAYPRHTRAALGRRFRRRIGEPFFKLPGVSYPTTGYRKLDTAWDCYWWGEPLSTGVKGRVGWWMLKGCWEAMSKGLPVAWSATAKRFYSFILSPSAVV